MGQLPRGCPTASGGDEHVSMVVNLDAGHAVRAYAAAARRRRDLIDQGACRGVQDANQQPPSGDGALRAAPVGEREVLPGSRHVIEGARHRCKHMPAARAQVDVDHLAKRCSVARETDAR